MGSEMVDCWLRVVGIGGGRVFGGDGLGFGVVESLMVFGIGVGESDYL